MKTIKQGKLVFLGLENKNSVRLYILNFHRDYIVKIQDCFGRNLGLKK